MWETKLSWKQRRDPLTDVDVFFSGQRTENNETKSASRVCRFIQSYFFLVLKLESIKIRSVKYSTVVTYLWNLWTVTSPTNEHPQFKKHFNLIFFAIHFTSTSFSCTQVQAFEYSTWRTASEHWIRFFNDDIARISLEEEKTRHFFLFLAFIKFDDKSTSKMNFLLLQF